MSTGATAVKPRGPEARGTKAGNSSQTLKEESNRALPLQEQWPGGWGQGINTWSEGHSQGRGQGNQDLDLVFLSSSISCEGRGTRTVHEPNPAGKQRMAEPTDGMHRDRPSGTERRGGRGVDAGPQGRRQRPDRTAPGGHTAEEHP